MVELFQKFFPGRKGESTKDQETVPVPMEKYMPEEKPAMIRSLYRVSTCQSTGIERNHNEDTLFAVNARLDGLKEGVPLGIFLVADGMGGHQSGEVASHLAAQGFSQSLMTKVYSQTLFEGQSFTTEQVEPWMEEAVFAAHKLVQQQVPGGGTTLTAVLALGDQLYSAHVGDSRLYVVRSDGALVLKSRDHSLVRRLVDLGEITPGQAAVHPHRNVLLRALGQADALEIDLDHFNITEGERLLLCSDGLWGPVGEIEMQKILGSGADLDQVALDLVKAANLAGGPDNISVLLVEKISSKSD